MIRFDRLEELVKKYLEKEPTGHDYLHALRVCNNAKELLVGIKCDHSVVLAACLVHDLIDHKLDPQFKMDLNDLNKELESVGFSCDQIKMIEDIITNMSFSKKGRFDYIEGQITQDSDRLDALGAIGIARTFAFGGAHKRQIYDMNLNLETSVGHFYDKLFLLSDLMNTEEGKKEALKRTLFMKEFIEKLSKEINYSTFRKSE